MRRIQAILVAALAISMAGCVLSGKPKAVPPPPPPPQPVALEPPPAPLSIPQTHPDLYEPQPVDPKALVTAQPVEPPAPVQVKPTPPPPARRPPTAQPKPADPPPAETSRPPIQEILPADLQKQLQASVQNYKSETRTLLAQAQRRRLTVEERNKVASITQFLKLSEEAETGRDLRSAEQLAARACLLARDLQNGK